MNQIAVPKSKPGFWLSKADILALIGIFIFLVHANVSMGYVAAFSGHDRPCKVQRIYIF